MLAAIHSLQICGLQVFSFVLVFCVFSFHWHTWMQQNLMLTIMIIIIIIIIVIILHAKITICIIEKGVYCTSLNCILGIMKVWDFQPVRITALHFSLAALVRHSQAQNIFRSTLNPSNKLLWNFLFNWIFYYLTKWITNWCLQPSITRSAMERATSLMSSLLDITSSLDVPFCQLQQLHSKHRGGAFVLVPWTFSVLSLTMQGIN